jgi:proteasome activator subunit 4
VNGADSNHVAEDRNSHRMWGKFYEGHEVQVRWHVPSQVEISFALEMLDSVTNPALLAVERLIKVPASDRDKIWRNDFVSLSWDV